MTKGKGTGFIRLYHEMMRTPAWQALSVGATCLLLEIWSHHNGKNNGEITYSQRQAEHRFRASPKRVLKWFRELEDKGFIVATRRGSFRVKSGAFVGRATTWRLTMERSTGDNPTREYLKWTPLNSESAFQKGSAAHSKTEALQHKMHSGTEYGSAPNRIPKRKHI